MFFECFGMLFLVVLYIDFCVVLAAPAGQCTLKNQAKPFVFSRDPAWSLFSAAPKKKNYGRRINRKNDPTKTTQNEHANNTEKHQKRIQQ